MKRVDLYAFACAILLMIGWQIYSKRTMEITPASDWFIVSRVLVPDFEEGKDPDVVYDRQVLKPFFASYVVNFYDAEHKSDYPVCHGDGNGNYKIRTGVPPTLTLSKYASVDCHLPPGQYYMATDWELRPDGYPSKIVSNTSSIFHVLPRGAVPYISLEQTKKLDGVIP